MDAFVSRLRMPGTLRSVALALFALKALLPETWGAAGLTVDDIQNLLSLAILLLAGTSAAMPDRSAQVAAEAKTAAEQAAAAAVSVNQAANVATTAARSIRTAVTR